MGRAIEEVKSPSAPPAIGPYSQAIRAKARGLVFVSGQIGIDPVKGNLSGDSIEEQTRRCIENIRNILISAGADLSSVVKTTVYLKNLSDFSKVNQVYESLFSRPYPARACVEVKDLPKGALIEIDAIAVLEDENG